MNLQEKNIGVAFIHRFLGLGGVEQVSLQTGLIFQKLGVRSYYLTQEYIPEQWVCPDSFSPEIEHLPNKKELTSLDNINYITGFCKKRNVSIVIFPTTNKNPYLYLLKEAGLKIIVWAHSIPFWEKTDWLIPARVNSLKSFRRALLFWLIRYPIECLLGCKENRVKKIYRSLIQNSDKFISLCPEYNEELVEELGLSQCDIDKLDYVYNRINLEECPKLEKENLIVFVGRLSYKDKRPERVLLIWEKIMNKLPNWHVEIWGDGDEYAYLQKQIKNKKLERIELKGYISNPKGVYQRAAILMLTSTFEGWPLVLVESQSLGTIPMAFDVVAGIRSIIGKNQECGRLICPFDIEEYASKLYELCVTDETRAQLQTNCMELRTKYSPHLNIPVWTRILTELIPQGE
jgi:glycosyltransferase, family 1